MTQRLYSRADAVDVRSWSDLEHLPEPFRSTANRTSPDSARGGSTLEEMEKVFILAALKRHGWNRGNAAKELGIHRSTLRRKMKTLGIEASHEDERDRE